MADLHGWTILNLRSRLDRRLIAVMQAHIMQVPVNKIEIWEAKDPVELGISDLPTLLDAIANDGFPEFRDSGKRFNPIHLGLTCHLWNICRFLRNLIERDETRMFIHDGVYLANCTRNFIPTFGWLNQVVKTLRETSKRDGVPFRVFLSGHRQPKFSQPYEPIDPGSFIMRGILSSDNFARIYSPEGAEFVLKRFLSDPFTHSNSILGPKRGETDAFFMTPGFYSAMLPFFTDAPSAWLGANTRDNLTSYQGEYARLFPREMLPNTWLTNTKED